VFSFALGKLRVRLAWGFFLLAAAPGIAGGPRRMLQCAGLVLFVMLAHELGHALCAMAWGSRATIAIRFFGGCTEITPPLTRGREIISAFAGPLANLALGLGFWAAHAHLPGAPWLRITSFVHLGWGLVNLLPVLPFDGGRILLSVLGAKRRAPALLISGALALLLTLEGLLVVCSAPLAFVFAAATFASFLAWAKVRRDELDASLHLTRDLGLARASLARGEAEAARQLATRVAVRAQSGPTQNAAWEMVAWSELALDRSAKAEQTLARIRPRHAVDSHCLAAVEAACGRPRRAICVLEGARQLGPLNRAAVRTLVDLYAGLGEFEQACKLASAELSVLGSSDALRVVQAALAARAVAAASELAEHIGGGLLRAGVPTLEYGSPPKLSSRNHQK